ncbi:TBC1 domain family member 12-like [Copidosoma floridanum]|uniref:TBC1 domain family member 12-like n=1 Tax=Copidosoma floridanum TaxID=29053 RepID=UPI0006C9E207|nr:TBC1 domain family member 12-like [Copidosoma floridanum]XP_014217330.1 TBC1 domain family member 12-like [Copidosoma floridanum]
MKSPPTQPQLNGCGGLVSKAVKNGGDSNAHLSRTFKANNYINGSAKIGKQQLVSLNGDSIRCNSVESDEALACDVAPVPIKTKTKALCVHIRENKWYDAGNVVSVGVAGTSLNEALESMSLAYSPTTKQIYSLEETQSPNDRDSSKSNDSLRLDVDSCSAKDELQNNSGNNSPAGSLHRSCSSTVSSLSECSASHSFLGNEESPLSPNKSKLWALNSGFIKNVFSWRSGTKDQPEPQKSPTASTSPSRNSDKIGGSLALIQQCRPANLPAKSALEEEEHRRQYNAILEAARKREQREERERRLQREQQLREEERLAEDSQVWVGQVLPRFDALKETRRVRDLWWRGLPPSIRGRVWRLAIRNSLNVTSQLYALCLDRAFAQPHSEAVAAIRLDVARTFPTLCVFQEGGPLSENLRNVLAAYAVYRPDIGYVQGMSYIGAVLSLNMEASVAFTCFANLLNQPCHLAAFTLDQRQMNAYYKAYSNALANKLPKVYTHFVAAGLSPDLYLLDWLYTIYAKAMPLDVACRVWDMFLRDGDEFLFRTALGVLHLYQDELLDMDFVRGAQFLTRLPENIQADTLFNSISQVSTTVGTTSFQQMLEQILAST